MPTIKGTFDITGTPQPSTEGSEAVGAMRMVFRKTFHGPLQGTSVVEMMGIMYKESLSGAYVALEKIDPRLIDAARDLYSSTWRAFRKIVFPLSLPGVFAGSLLVFIPAAGDFVNAYYLGSVKTTMIGNVVQNQFLVQVNYPVAAALSFVLLVLVIAISYGFSAAMNRISQRGKWEFV